MAKPPENVDLYMTYDSECDVSYVRFNDRLPVKNADIGESVLVGPDANGEVVDLEILDLHHQLKIAEATLDADLAKADAEESVTVRSA